MNPSTSLPASQPSSAPVPPVSAERLELLNARARRWARLSVASGLLYIAMDFLFVHSAPFRYYFAALVASSVANAFSLGRRWSWVAAIASWLFLVLMVLAVAHVI